MVIQRAPENYQDTSIFKLLIAKSSPDDGLTNKVTTFINTARPLQELIIAGPFKDYTLHNPNHSKKLLHLSEYIIPKETFNDLSALELSILIMSFYLHDLGMVVTETERDRTLKSKEFIDFVNVIPEYGDKLDRIRKLLEEIEGTDRLPLETSLFQITEAALAAFLRPRHATRERYESLIAHIIDSSGRNDIYDINGVSFKNELIEICISHNLNSSALLESKGIHLDRYPRAQIISSLTLNSQYCSAILRIVDILDFDKERTPKSLFKSLGIRNKRLPGFEISLKEWNKHLAIHTISINENEIVVSGDSYHPAIEHAIREFCLIIEREIVDTQTVINQNSPEILKKYKLELPVIVRAEIRSINYVYKDYSIKLNESAIVNLLMGENLYIDTQVALRELIQNSIDACKLRRELEDNTYEASIKISMYKDEDARTWLKIIDNGIGMDEYVLSNYFFKIGNSYYSSNEFKKFSSNNNIDRFTPISRFGIGLLSVFMIGELIKVKTKNNLSSRSDRKERTLLIDGSDSLAVVTEQETGEQGTTVEVLLRSKHDNEKYFNKLYGFIKENVIRPAVPIELVDFKSKSTKIIPNNYIGISDKAKPILKKNNIELVQIDFERFSDLIKGKGVFFFFEDKNKKLSYYDPNNKIIWGNYPLKENFLFENFLGGSRITVNGMLMRFKKIGSLFNVGKMYTSVVLDIEIQGVKEIEYDVSRDRVFGKGLFIIRKEIFKSIKKGLKELGVYSRLNEETLNHFERSVIRKVPSEPLDKDLVLKIKSLLPDKGEWKTGIHKEIANKLDISNVKATKYITAMIKMGTVTKPIS